MQIVQLSLKSATIKKVVELKTAFKTTNNTDVVVRAVRLTHAIVSEILDGGRIELHRKNGDICVLNLVCDTIEPFTDP